MGVYAITERGIEPLMSITWNGPQGGRGSGISVKL